MVAKKVLATIFAALTLVKLLALWLTPDKWLNLTKLILRHQVILNYVYLALLAITGYLIFSSLNLIDIALAMFFTSLLTGLFLPLIPPRCLNWGRTWPPSVWQRPGFPW